MRPQELERERGVGEALRALLAAWLVGLVLQALAGVSYLAYMSYLSRELRGAPGWLEGLAGALRVTALASSALGALAMLRYARASLAGDRELALGAAAVMLVSLAIDVVQTAIQTAMSSQLITDYLRWIRVQRWLWWIDAGAYLMIGALLGASMWLGCRRRGGRAHVALAAPLVAVRMLPLLYLVTEWTPMRYALHDRSKFLLWYGGLLAAGTVASALFALLLARHARAVEIRPRVLEASAGLRGHADAVVARVVVLVGAAVLGVMAALGKSLAMVKVVMVIGPLGGVAAGAFVVLGAARFARASVSARLWAHCAAVLLLAGVVIDTQVLALMLGLFWGRGDLLDRLQHIMRWSPSIELCGQLVGAAALICMLVALAEVGRERAVREAGSRAFGIGAGLGVLVLCGALLRHYLPALAAGGGGLLTLGVGLLAAAIWLFVAYLGLVRDTARALAAPEAPPLLS